MDIKDELEERLAEPLDDFYKNKNRLFGTMMVISKMKLMI